MAPSGKISVQGAGKKAISAVRDPVAALSGSAEFKNQVRYFLQHSDEAAKAISQDVSMSHPAAVAMSLRAGEAAKAAQISVADVAIDGASKAVSIGGWLPLLVMPLTMAGNGLEKLGNWKSALAPAKKAGAALKAPGNLFDKTLVEAGDAMKVGKAAGRATQTVFDRVFAPAAEVTSRITGFGNWRRARHLGKSAMHFEAAQDLAKNFNFSAVPESLHPHFQGIKDAVSRAEHVGNLQTASGHIEAATAAINELAKNGAIDKATQPTLVHFEKMMGSVGSAIEHHNSAADWKNIKSVVSNAPKALGQAKVGHAVLNGSFIAMSGFNMVGHARGFMRNLASLSDMYTVMTGKKASALKLLLGTVPAPVAEARLHLLKNIAVKEATEAASMAVLVKQAMDHKFSGTKALLAFSAPQAVGSLADGMMGSSILPIFTAFNEAYKQGQPIPAEVYAAFIGTASKELKARGGVESQFTQELAKQYAAEKAAPAEILSEIDNGKLMERISALILANKWQQPMDPIPRSVSHTARLNGEIAERPVVGPHTEKLGQTSNDLGHIGPSVT